MKTAIALAGLLLVVALTASGATYAALQHGNLRTATGPSGPVLRPGTYAITVQAKLSSSSATAAQGICKVEANAHHVRVDEFGGTYWLPAVSQPSYETTSARFSFSGYLVIPFGTRAHTGFSCGALAVNQIAWFVKSS